MGEEEEEEEEGELGDVKGRPGQAAGTGVLYLLEALAGPHGRELPRARHPVFVRGTAQHPDAPPPVA